MRVRIEEVENNMQQAAEPRYSLEEISKHLGISKETIYRWLEKGKIPAHKVGKQWRFKPSEVDEWVKSGNASEERV